MPDLLLELLSEEIPARMQRRAGEDLAKLVGEKLASAGLGSPKPTIYTTPRRLALALDGLPARQPDVSEEVKGPREGAPEAAMKGFLKNAGLADLSQAELRDTPKGKTWFAVKRRAGRATSEVLAEILPPALEALPWPKSMRWGTHTMRWVRPLHRIVCLFDGKVVPFPFGHLTAGDTTEGHRFMGGAPFQVSDHADYVAKLAIACVRLSHAERREAILADARKLAEAEQLRLVEDAALADEVAGLVEWPVVLLGRFDEDFLAVPREALSTAMRAHQKYFSLERHDGSLAPRFIVVANMVTQDGGATIVGGNERVIRARLADARFFWDQDRKTKLEARVPRLRDIVFHAKLGTMAQKTARMETLARVIAPSVAGANVHHCERAAHLAKADLVTEMVGEFPELQGIMGRYYAHHDGEPKDVAEAIAEHYAPLGPSDQCPSAPASVVVALADKIDTLVGFFAVNERPTGSRDPYALRRAALGVIRLIVENGLRLPLVDLFEAGLEAYRLHGGFSGARLAVVSVVPGTARRADTTSLQLLEFFADRVKVHLRERDIRHDLVSAVLGVGGEDDLVRLNQRVEALRELIASEDGANLLVAYRRAANILRIEEKRDDHVYEGGIHIDTGKFRQNEERDLWRALTDIGPRAQVATMTGEFVEACRALAQLRHPVDAFFDKVTVNADDPTLRANRLHLLASIRGVLHWVADFSKLEG